MVKVEDKGNLGVVVRRGTYPSLRMSGSVLPQIARQLTLKRKEREADREDQKGVL